MMRNNFCVLKYKNKRIVTYDINYIRCVEHTQIKLNTSMTCLHIIFRLKWEFWFVVVHIISYLSSCIISPGG